MKRTHIALLAGTLVLAASGAIALAPPPGSRLDPMRPGATVGPRFDAPAGRGMRRDGPRGLIGPRELADYLGLTDEQRASARELLRKQHDTLRPLMETRRDLRDQLDAMLDDPGADAAALGKLVQEIHANRQQLETARQQMAASLETILTADQKARFEQLRAVMDNLRAMRESRRATANR